MAGSRLHRTGSIFTRVTGLLKGGAMKEEEKPLWYDIYKAFPPKHEPTYARPAVEKEIRPIYYPEDVIRGKFAKVYGSPGYHDMLNENSRPVVQRFVEKYMELEKTGKYSSEDDIFEATKRALAEDGYVFEDAKSLPHQESVSSGTGS